ncbi:protease modulator HflC [Larsenimonas suaedae]|uniref:Protein HflC n=1 Tax=Larsenimonas suaedae TaxID=1851019 RepID=A0ABU1GY37_9GAMM|nr:protease modulator HflC [Larsenimonas suaedae]MCM2972852.1 protease modulator HflC [Larsenimonas suaedae]MDR5896951.1 protease modulator HflC [Larsenimonas suaedae]
MLNNRALVIIAVLAVAAWIANSSMYIVNETQRAIKLRFGEVVQADIQPGLHFKWPLLNTVRTFDGRVMSLDASASRYLTKDKKAVIVDSYVKWKIIDPQSYYEATSGDEQMAERLIAPRVDERLRNEFGKLELSDIVADRSVAAAQQKKEAKPETEEATKEETMDKPTNDLDAAMRNELGVAILDIRVKRIDLPSEVSQAVYERMRSERHREAQRYRAEGRQEAEEIKAKADQQSKALLADAREKSETIRGQGDAQAATIYANAYTQNEDFFRFYRSLESYRDSFGKQSNNMLVLSPDSKFFQYFNGANGEQPSAP